MIHVAGTNGKGSVVAMVRAGLEATGARVHVYTSPHLARFHERIRLAGALIDEDRLVAELERCEAANGGAPITFFEITTAAAFLAMAETPADYTLLEVGLGGRLDATNVIDRPRLSVVTPVSIDHQQYLGETLAEIAGEKAGILKPGVPAIVGEQEPEASPSSRRAPRPSARRSPSPTATGRCGRSTAGSPSSTPTAFSTCRRPVLIGRHQVAERRHRPRRAARSSAPATTPAPPPSPAPNGPRGSSACAAARWWTPRAGPSSGSTAATTRPPGAALAEALTRLPPRPLHLVTGMLNTKDIAGYLRPLAPLARSLRGVTIPGETATLTARGNRRRGPLGRHPGEPAPSVAAAVAAPRRDPVPGSSSAARSISPGACCKRTANPFPVQDSILTVSVRKPVKPHVRV